VGRHLLLSAALRGGVPATGSESTADITKVKPLVFAPDTQAYYGIGSFIARAFGG
jgi:hypothetical protein